MCAVLRSERPEVREDPLADLAAQGAPPAQIILEKSRNYIEAWRTTRHLEDWADQQRRMVAETSHEYGRRFILELVQNACDTQIQGTPGRIEVSWQRDEGDFGVLYIANTGQAFSYSNFRAICKLGKSDKKPGASIGHKGVGFKSVLQISKWPEIYSKAPGTAGTPAFGGYCFGFASKAVLHEITDSPEEAALVGQEISPYFLPVPLDPLDADLGRFSDMFVTVIRLPIKSADARNIVDEELERLLAAEAPLLLFLENIESMNLTVTSAERTRATEHKRQVAPVEAESTASTDRFIHVSLGTNQDFLLAQGRCDETEFKQALAKTLDEDLASDEWSKWTGDANVAVAVSLAGEISAPKLYTYLPLLGSVAPCWAHVQAPFVTNMGRGDLDPSLPVNAFLLDQCARLAVRSAHALARLRAQWVPGVVVDLVVWDTAEAARLKRAGEEEGIDIARAALVPATSSSGRGVEWTSFYKAYRVSADGHRVVTRSNLIQLAKALLTHESLGDARTERLHQFCRKYRTGGLEPDANQWAAWTEKLATALAKRPFQSKSWDAFYNELSHIDALQKAPGALLGRRILLDEDLRLQWCGRPVRDTKKPHPAVYFRPLVGEAAAALRVPPRLQKHFVIMHPALKWQRRDGTNTFSTDARKFLQDNSLVQEFERRNLLTQLGTILRATVSDATREAGLRFAFSLVDGAPDGVQPIDDLELWVPTRGGWTRAGLAVFTHDWGTPMSALLDEYVRTASSQSEAVADLGRRGLASPTELRLGRSSVPAWVEFLRWAGVRDGLWPQPGAAPRTLFKGSELTARSVARAWRLTDSITDKWARLVRASGEGPLFESSTYVATSPLWILPGLADHEMLSPSARRLFARLVIGTLDAWDQGFFEAEFAKRPAWGQARFTWPSPLVAALRDVSWLPARLGAVGGEEYVRPEGAWMSGADETERVPAFVRLIPRDIPKTGSALARLRELGVGTWGDPDNAEHVLVYLTDLFTGGQIQPHLFPSFWKAYEECWEMLRTAGPSGARNPNRPTAIIAWERGTLIDRPLTDRGGTNTATVYVDDLDNRVLSTVLESFGALLIRFAARTGLYLLAQLKELGAQNLHGFSELQLEIQDGDKPIAIDQTTPLLLTGRPWLRLVMMLVIEYRTSEFVRRLLRPERVLASLGRIRVRPARDLKLRVERGGALVGEANPPALAMHHDTYPTVIHDARATPGSAQWFELVLPRVADLLRRPELTTDLRLALKDLAQEQGGELLAAPTDRQLAAVFDLPEATVSGIRRTLAGDWDSIQHWLEPILIYFSNTESLTIDMPATEAEGHSLLQALIPGMDTEQFFATLVDASGPYEIVQALGLEFSRFNRILAALPDHQGMDNSAEQADHFLGYLAEVRSVVLASLTPLGKDDFQAGREPTDYIEARQLEGLVPDATWATTCWIPTDDMMLFAVEQWLSQKGCRVATTQAATDLRVSQNRSRQAAKAAGKRLATLVPAWCGKQTQAVPAIWSDPVLAPERLAVGFEDRGLLDFDPLDSASVLAWAHAMNLLPSGMPATFAMNELGLTESDLKTGETSAADARKARERERRLLIIDGSEPVEAVAENMGRLEVLLLASIRKGELGLPPLQPQTLPPRRGRSQGSAKHGRLSRGHAHATDSDELLGFVGYLGEVYAYRWLGEHYRVGRESWRSTMADRYFETDHGDDSLGYDFEVFDGRSRLYVEVKATRTDVDEIELGTSELYFAKRHVDPDRYRILFIANLLDSQSRRVALLPNPFSSTGSGLFRQIDAGLRYQFRSRAG